MSDVRLLAGEVGAKAELLDVALRSVQSELELSDQAEKLSIDVSWETSFRRPEEDEHDVEYRYRIAVTATPARAFAIRAEFVLMYAMGAHFSDEQLAAFGEVSVEFSALPYARELIQSLTTRASLPPLVLATLRAPIDPPVDGVGTKRPPKQTNEESPKPSVGPSQRTARTESPRARKGAKASKRAQKS